MQAEFNDFLEVFNGQGNASQELYDFFVCGVIDIAAVYGLKQGELILFIFCCGFSITP